MTDDVRSGTNDVKFTDVIIDSPNPEALDQVLHGLKAVVVGIGEGGPVRQGDGWLVRVFGDPGFVQFAVERQGYGQWRGFAS